MIKKSESIIIKRVLYKKRLVILFGVIGIVISIAYAFVLASELNKNMKDLKIKKAEVVTIKQQINRIDKNALVTIQESGKSIDLFMPKQFDLFSMISFIDSVSRKTNMRVGSIVLTNKKGKKSDIERKSINIMGDLSFQEFLDFLKKYKYITGNLLSIQEVNITTLENDSIQLTAEIFAYNPQIDLTAISINALTEKEREVLSRIVETVQPLSNGEDSVSDSYSSKTDPFE